MILSSHQPNFIPYMGFFYKAAKSDILVLSEDVAFSKSGMHNWNRINTWQGPKKLTLPVNAHHDMRLADVLVHDPGYSIGKIAKTLDQEYRKADHYRDGIKVVEQMLWMAQNPDLKMADFNTVLITYMLRCFGIEVELMRSTRELTIQGHKDERLFQMCEQTGADTYLSGTGARVYHIPEEYDRRNIKLVYTDYTPIEYRQVHGGFVENLSVIDYIFNMGFALPEGWAKNE